MNQHQDDKKDNLSLLELASSLRDEIVESQKARIDFLKYKLIVIGGIGMAGLGFFENTSFHPAIVALIPICCLYIDILCYHNTMRILVIGNFFSSHGCPYEGFLSRLGLILYNVGVVIKQRKSVFKTLTSKKKHCQKMRCTTKFNRISDFIKKDRTIQIRSMVEKDIVNRSDTCPRLIDTSITKNPYEHCAEYFFDLEDWALHMSTLFSAITLVISGFLYLGISFLNQELPKVSLFKWLINDLFKVTYPHVKATNFEFVLMLFISVVVMLMSLTVKKWYTNRKEDLYAATEREKIIQSFNYVVHNATIHTKVKEYYNASDIDILFNFLLDKGTFNFPVLDNGLFPAADLQSGTEYTGYHYVWVRDNVHIAYSHYVIGKKDIAIKTVSTLATYFLKQKYRFENIISKDLDPNVVMNRPHIRFSGNDLAEIDVQWAHAQNDALGYFLWIYSIMCHNNDLPIDDNAARLLSLFCRYFASIEYWSDEDSGHWEEKRKIEASSIGTVISGLLSFRSLLQSNPDLSNKCSENNCTLELVDLLICKGLTALFDILPCECNQTDPKKARRYDAALLFLIFPLDLIKNELAHTIVKDITDNLLGDYGIRRYLGDSFWAANYKKKRNESQRTIDCSDDEEQAKRDRLHEPGIEAQWCLFDPILSIIYGKWYRETKNLEYLKYQTYHFNRALGQLTEDNLSLRALRCPELYYFDNENYIPNDTVPLLWTQANLMMAFKFMKDTCRITT